jgi:PAS domain S-box-containing protein
MVKQRVLAAGLAGLGLVILGAVAADGLIHRYFDYFSELLAAALVLFGGSLLAFAYLDERRRVGNLRRALWRRRKADTRSRDVLEQVNDIIARRNGGGRLTYVNPAFCEVFGVTAIDVLGRPFDPLVIAGDRSPYAAERPAAQSGVLTLRYEQCLRTRYGNRWYSFEDAPIRSVEGELIEIQSVGRDITDRKQMELDLKAGRDLAEEGSQAKSMFLATMSHEIRTPMNGVLGMANLLLGTELTAEQRTYAQAVQESGEALMALINDILDFSKIESGRLALETSAVAPRALIQNVTELLSPRALEKGIALQSFVAPDVPEKVMADEGRLRQVILNLAGNAIKFTESGAATIELSCESAAGEERAALRLVVRDTGIGIPEDARARVFGEFEQGDGSTTRRFGGTGLGLAISKRIVEAMNGRIELEAGENGGTMFSVRFAVPVAEPALPQARPLEGLKVLVVTGAPLVGPLLARQLEAAGAEARTCESGAQALTLFSAAASVGQEFTTLIADESLREGAADQLLVPMRRGAPVGEGALRAILLLPVGAKRADIRQRGFDAYLVKPVRPSALIERVALVHGRGEASVEDERQPRRARSGRRQPRPDRKILSVLLAEDNDINALLVIALLAREGHTVDRVSNGQEALEAMERKAYDLILMDVHMPVMDGLAATRAIRARGHTALPIVALTANAMDEDRRICLDAGMDHYLSKPIDPDLFEQLIERLSGGPDAPIQADAAAG